jgi:hypothetical protein
MDLIYRDLSAKPPIKKKTEKFFSPLALTRLRRGDDEDAD